MSLYLRGTNCEVESCKEKRRGGGKVNEKSTVERDPTKETRGARHEPDSDDEMVEKYGV